jgi:phage I-like protein
MNTKSILNENSRAQSWRSRFNALANLDPAAMARHIDSFNSGRLGNAALIWDLLEQRDDLIRTVTAKRKKSVARQGYTITLTEGLPESLKAEAREHAAALEFFYRNLECESAIDSSEKGGFKLLVRQMMDAVGKRFAVHEIVWRKSYDHSAQSGSEARDNALAATFRFVPLSFFENTTGELRFLQNESMQTGVPLEPGAWMVTAGDGLMAATSIAWAYKHMSLVDWMLFCERNGRPVLSASTSSAPGTENYLRLQQSIFEAMNGQSVIYSSTDDIKVMGLLGGGQIPFPQMVERMDRMIAALWRGADLSTLSRDRGYGASLQEKETCALEEDDAEMLTETLNRYVDRWVIRYLFGENTQPLAHVKVLSAARECTPMDLQIDEFLLSHGAPLSIEAVLNRYGRVLPKAGETIFLSASRPGTMPDGDAVEEAGANGAHGRIKASRFESSHNLGMAEGMDNNHWGGCGVTVSPRSGLPLLKESGSPLLNPNGEVLQNHDDSRVRTGPALDGPCIASTDHPSPTSEDWVQLSPFGEFPHARGLQRVDRAAAEEMARRFDSFTARLGRLFGGLPFYVGHPDMPGAHELADRKAYGWVLALQSREDGLYARVKWSESGIDLLRNAHYKFLSPYWEAEEIGHEKGRRIFRPVALLSVGLTNTPNLPVKPLANEADAAAGKSADGENLSEDNGANTGLADADHLPERKFDWSALHTEPLTNGLGQRGKQFAARQNRTLLIREAVLQKTALGFTYNEAWEAVKKEHWAWFE